MEGETKDVTQETTSQEVENPAQKLAKAFRAAVEEIINRELGFSAKYRTEGKWVILSVYLSSSERRRLAGVLLGPSEKAARAILARHLNTPFKIKEIPTYRGHYFEVVALLKDTNNSEGARVKSFLQQC